MSKKLEDYLKSIKRTNELKRKVLTKKNKNGQLWLFSELGNTNKIAYLVYDILYMDLHVHKTKEYKRVLNHYLSASSEERTEANLAMQSLMKKLNIKK